MQPNRHYIPTARTRSRRHPGFTLIELLTVIAIIGVLATLLFTALAGAKKHSRQARCTANLHQIALAINMYLDDLGTRPPDLPVLVSAKYLPAPAVLLCPEDKTGNWGGLHNQPVFSPDSARANDASLSPPATGAYSYLHPLSWDDASWDRLIKSGPGAGLAVCQLHGLARSTASGSSGFPTLIQDFEGLILRAQADGAVVRRQWFWTSAKVATAGSPPAIGAFPANLTAPAGAGASPVDPWPLFSDDPPPQ